MTGKEKMIKALKHEPITGHVPHFELVFYLTMEVLGKVHPSHRIFHQWGQMSAVEKELQLQDQADCYIDIAEKYQHCAIFVHPSVENFDAVKRLLEIIRERSGDEYFIMLHGDSTYSIPDGEHMMDFSERLFEEPQSILDDQMRRTDKNLELASKFRGSGLIDGYALCSDYCFNTSSFFTNELFEELIVPPLRTLIAGYHEMGYYSIKHSDGNIMAILDQIVKCKPDALHSIDPQGGVDLAEVKEMVGDKVTLIGNVNCGLLQTGTEEQIKADVMRSLRQGMPGGGFIFSTSNCVYTGLALKRYELMHELWREHGIYTG